METQYISLNMTPTGVNPCFHISQYDVGRMLGFIVHSGGATVDLDTYTCTVEATRSDGTAITSAVATTDNIGTFEVTPTMSNKADKYRCQLIIVDENSKRIASLPFDMEVTKAAMDENSEAIEEDASLYQQYTEAVQGAIAEANADIQAEENARIAAVNAEATARQNADATLQNNIGAEATARQTADNTLQNNINSEASTRASADSNLQTQINQIIAPSGEAPSAAEVQNARIGADGVTYSTLGNAIRGQVSGLQSAISAQQGIPYFSAGTTFDVGIASGHAEIVFTAYTPNGYVNFMTSWGSSKSKTLAQVAESCSYASINGNTITFTIPNNYCIYWDYVSYNIKTAVIGAVPFNGIALVCARYDLLVSGEWVEAYLKDEISKINKGLSYLKNVPFLTNGYSIEVTEHGNGNVTLKIGTTNGNVNFVTANGAYRIESISSIPTDVSFATVNDNTITFVIPSNTSLYYDIADNKVKTCYPGNIPTTGIDLFTVRYSHPVSGAWYEDYTYKTTRIQNNMLGWIQQRNQWSSYIGFSQENQNGIDTYLGKLLECSDNLYTALFFTDPHIWFTSNAQTNQMWMANIQRAFNISNSEDVVCGGDWLTVGATKAVAAYQLTNTAAWMRFLFLDKFHFVLGNHDTNIYASGGVESDENKLSYSQVGRLCCHPYSDNPYYSYETRKAKIIVLNSGDKTNTETTELYHQFDWLYGELMRATKPVIIYVHAMIADGGANIYTASQDLMDFLKANNDKGTHVQFDATYDFSEATQIVKAVICGHIHEYQERDINGIPLIVGNNVEGSGYYYWIIADFDNDKIHVISNHDNQLYSYDTP